MLASRGPGPEKVLLRNVARVLRFWRLKLFVRWTVNRAPELENDLLRNAAPEEKRVDGL